MEFSMIEEGDDIGFEEGRVWLPAHVLDEAWELKDSSLRPHQQNHHHQRRHHQRRPKTYLRADPVPRYHHYNSMTKSSTTILYQSSRPRAQGNQVSSAVGTGMQAVFLESGQKTCGTGFFLPRRAGGNAFQPNKKPACSPVLVPTRVIQALNLNVHELGSQLTPRRESNNKMRSWKQTELTSNKNGSDDYDDAYENVRCVASKGRTRSSSPEIFLPKEWSY